MIKSTELDVFPCDDNIVVNMYSMDFGFDIYVICEGNKEDVQNIVQEVFDYFSELPFINSVDYKPVRDELAILIKERLNEECINYHNVIVENMREEH